MAEQGDAPPALFGLAPADGLTQFLVEYLQANTPEGTFAEVTRLVEASRRAASSQGDGGWTAYAERRSLLEAAGAVLGGGPAALEEVGRRVFDTIRRPELLELLRSLGSPAAVYKEFPGLLHLFAPAFTMSTEILGPNECRIQITMLAPYEPFRELCAFGLGMASTLPQLFGFSEADITHESCECDGAPCCSARLRWDDAEGREAEARRAAMRIRLLEARLDEIQSTVAELGSTEGLQHVLTRVLAGATRAVEAPQFILDIKASATSNRFVRTKGLDVADGAAVTRAIRASGTSPSPHVLVTEVASERAHYGNLVAIRPGAGSFEPRERSVLESYARLAASALDSEAAVVEARRQAETAQALLALATSLGDFSTSEQMAQHLAQIIPSVIDCDRAIVSLAISATEGTWAFATSGFTPADTATLRSIAPPLSGSSDPRLYRHPLDAPPGGLSRALEDAGSVAASSLGIFWKGELFGWITIDVIAHPERLDDDVEIAERLRGLAAQTAIAMYNARLLDKIRYQALHDSLTGLPNRVLVADRVERATARGRRDGVDMALFFIDLDGFKDVNDSLGHKVGDDLLCAVAARFSATLREADSVARLGGDEFVVLAEGIALNAGPEVVAERLLAVLAEPFVLGDAEEMQIPVFITASIGVALGVRDSSEELFRDADVALYRAKEAGKNRYVIFESGMYAALHDRHEMERDLQAAIGTEQFFLRYQPIFNLSDMSVIGVEALLRWNHPVKGLLQPDEFIPALELSGLIIPVGRWVAAEACRQAMVWHAMGHPVKMSINASARQLDANTLFDDVCAALDGSGLPPELLIVEITETCLMHDAKGAKQQLNALKALGVRIAIDDFGTGYSSLAYLQQFPVDSLKIDRSFIAGMGKSPEGDTLIRTLIQLGKALKLETLAEGIEDEGQLAQLRGENCDVGQGYFFARPVAPEQIEEYLNPVVSATVG